MLAAAAAPHLFLSRKRSVRAGMCLASTFRPPCWRGRGKSRRRVCLFTSRLRTQPCTPSNLKASTCSSPMFFADPALSFANLRRALRPSGRLAFACWREPRENPFFMAPLQAVYKHAPRLPQPEPEEPGPFSFASEQRVRRILSAAGFQEIAMEACDLSLDLAVGRGLGAAVQSALEIGPAARALAEQSPDVVAAATNSIREALAPFARREAVPLPAAIWIVTARPT